MSESIQTTGGVLRPKDIDFINMPFEFTDIACPKDYDSVLRRTYGNYMKFVKGSKVHTMVLCDPNTPFKIKMYDKFIR